MTPEELKALLDEQAKIHSEFKAYADKSEAEIKRLGVELPETKAALTKLNERLDELETKLNRPAAPAAKQEGQPSERKAAFEAWARKGEVTPEERKALSVSTDTAGGYLAPTEYINEIIKGLVQFSPLRALARIRTTSSKASQFPKRTGTPTAAWVAEAGAKGGGSPTASRRSPTTSWRRRSSSATRTSRTAPSTSRPRSPGTARSSSASPRARRS